MVEIDESASNETVTFNDTSKVLEDISSLYNNEKFSDVAILCGTQRFHAHKAILAVRSEYFESLLYVESEDIQDKITIPDVSSEAFAHLLKYIYTGTITMSLDVTLILHLLELAHQFLFTDLLTAIINKIKSLLNFQNICSILNTANLYDLDDLRNHCHAFIELNATKVISGECFSDLTQKSVIKLLERDSLIVPEIEIFKSVAKWIKINNDVDDLVIRSVRLSSLSVVEIVSIVWPSKLVNCEKLLQAVAEIVGVKPKSVNSRAILMKDENIATSEYGAEVVSGLNTSKLLSENRNIEIHAGHNIGDSTGIVIKLGDPYYFNHIKMMLYDADMRYYSYYVEVSLDRKHWRKIIDYSSFACRSYQNLYFNQQIARYIRIVGTTNTSNNYFHLVFFELYFKNEVPKTVNSIICPKSNVATVNNRALVLPGAINSTALLNGDYLQYDGSSGFTYHTIGVDQIIVQLAQPYLISSMKLLLWDKDGRKYRYYIETSTNKRQWEIAVDKRGVDCRSWQDLRFNERTVVFIKITGTHNSNENNNGFHCVHFECPSESN